MFVKKIYLQSHQKCATFSHNRNEAPISNDRGFFYARSLFVSRSSRFPCRHYLCPALLDNPGYCARHAHEAKVYAKAKARVHDIRRGSSTQRGYDRHWRKLRDRFLSDHPLCVSCRAQGRLVEAKEIDHIIPVQIDPGRMHDESNLQALCKACHTAKTNRDRVQYDLYRVGGFKSLKN